MAEKRNELEPAEPESGGDVFTDDESMPDENVGTRFFGMQRSTVMLSVMFLGGIAWVLFVSRQLDPAGQLPGEDVRKSLVSAGLVDMERLATAPKNYRDRTETMKRVIYYQARHRQIPLEDLKENPFMLLPLQKNTSPPEPETQPAVVEEPPPEPEPAPKIDDLRVQSIVVGENSCAMISGHLVTEGQCLRGWAVADIKEDRVVLQWKDQRRVLKMP